MFSLGRAISRRILLYCDAQLVIVVVVVVSKICIIALIVSILSTGKIKAGERDNNDVTATPLFSN